MSRNKHSAGLCRVFAGICACLLCSCSANQEHASADGQKTSYASIDGRRLYMHYCAICHGEKGDGAGRYYGFGLEPKPADFTDDRFFEKRDSELLYKAISEGSASVGRSNLCPPWGRTLHKEEVGFLIDHIRSFPGSDDSPEDK